MFDRIGLKIKGYAKFVCFVGIGISLILGYIIGSLPIFGGGYYGGGQAVPFLGFAVAAIGSLVSWVNSFVLVGFGELVDAAMQMKQMYSYAEGASIIKEEVNKPWICSHCGQENSIVSAQCKGCGKYRS